MKAVRGKYFFGGVHPIDRKSLASSAPLEVMPDPESVAISTLQSLGKPAVPVVEVGQEVVRGQLIAKADGPISSDVFSSICGTVEDIRDEIAASGALEKFIVIKNNGKTDNAHLPPLTSPTPDEIKQRIKDAGIVGLGGAGFPTAVKVSPRTPVDTLILNGAECEPYLTCDHRLMLEKTDDIVRGARYIATALGVKNIIIGIEANKPDCIAKFEPYDDIKVVILKKKYPMGGEKQLVYVTTGRRIGLPPKLPADSGVVVSNVATAFAVCEAIELGKQLYERVLTFSGGAAANPKNLWVKLGTKVESIVNYCGGAKVKPRKIIQGGPMTGVALSNFEVYTHKATSGILLLTDACAAAENPTPCLNCGKCADICPMHLMPMNTEFYALAGDYASAAKYGGTLACIECGACTYNCPAKRPLMQSIRRTKAEMRKLGGQKK